MSEHQPPVDPAHLETLYEITRTLNSSLDLNEVLDYVMDQVVAVTRAERGFLMLLDDESGILRFQVARGMNRQDLETPEFEVSTTIIREVLKLEKAILTLNAEYEMESESIVSKGLHSILCVPILVRDKLIGLVYLDNRLRVGMFNETHRDLLAALASEAGFAIENARLYQVAVEKGRLQSELEMARRIQEGLLPAKFDPIPGYEVAFAWMSAREVAGDFYDCFVLNEQRMGIVVADVSDKGAAAAIFMAVARSLFRGNALSASSAIDTVQHTNHLLMQDASNGMFVTLYYAIFEADGYMQGVNAGHNLPIRYRGADDELEFLPRGGHPLGWFPNIPLRLYECQMQPGDVLVFYTDGLTEAENRHQEPYGDRRLKKVLRENAHRSAAQIKNAILDSVREFEEDAPPFDDLTLVVVRYVGAG